MTNQEFKEFATNFIKKEEELLISKGEEYTGGNSDRLSAFKQIAATCTLEQIDICQVFLLKHMQSINLFINEGVEGKTENIFERIHDARNYLLFLAAMIKERDGEAVNEKLKI